MPEKRCANTSCHYTPAGWMHWPDHEDYSFQFMRLLGVAQEGASSLSECFMTADRIVPGNDESWYREWRRIGDKNKERGDHAFELGYIETAKSNWLRASCYFRTSECFLNPADQRRQSLFELVDYCSRAYLQNITPQGEHITIPHDSGLIYGYFLRAPSASAKSPVVLCFGGLADSKDDQLLKMPRHAFARGLSLLLVDLPGQGATLRHSQLPGCHNQEMAIGECVDYLISRDDIDETRIVLYGDGFGGAYASRAASLDVRIAAAVCDGGIWDLRERQYLINWASGFGQSRNVKAFQQCIATKIKCPFLVTIGEQDYVDVNDAVDLYNYCSNIGAPIELKVFTEGETGASHGQIDNPTLGKEFIFDWITTAIGICNNRGRLGGFKTSSSRIAERVAEHS